MFTKQDRRFKATNEECPWCCHDPNDEGETCDAQDPENGYGCTREPGHNGPHVACGTSIHALGVWEDT